MKNIYYEHPSHMYTKYVSNISEEDKEKTLKKQDNERLFNDTELWRADNSVINVWNTNKIYFKIIKRK